MKDERCLMTVAKQMSPWINFFFISFFFVSVSFGWTVWLVSFRLQGWFRSWDKERMASKEAVVILLDVGSSMARRQESIEWAIKAMVLLVQQKILFKPKDDVALVLFGTKGLISTKHAPSFSSLPSRETQQSAQRQRTNSRTRATATFTL